MSLGNSDWRVRSAGLLALAVLAAQPPALAADAGDGDRADMTRRLGITDLRPGMDADPHGANPANYDEAKATPFTRLPDPLTTNDGRSVTTARMWWRVRRPELAEAFSREVYGRVPAGIPPVRWRITSEERGASALGRTVRVRHLIGRVGDGRGPGGAVEMRMIVVTPADLRGPVPLLVMFAYKPPASPIGGPPDELRRERQLIEGGWGYAALETGTIQPDSGEGLRRGVIGLASGGGPRRPDDWGVLRAWAWGASRAFDWIATQPDVDRARIGVEGVSRYGKAALVAAAFDRRFAVVLIGSSGKGGTTLLRRNFGESVGNLASGAYYWMAGNFMAYDATRDGRRMSADDLPVDSHELLALVAPRPAFISYGVPEAGDAHWLDHRGSLMAAVAAGRVWRLLGARDLALGDDWRAATLAAVGQGLLAGDLAWRQHAGGHTDEPNIRTFVAWADDRLARGVR